MCVGENNALHTIAYLNAQLQSLWRISSECVESRDTNMKSEPIHRHSFALAEWHFGRHRPDLQASVEDMMFYARFEAPRLDFLCNHEAFFKINIAEGHYNLDYSSASDESKADRAQNRVFTPSSTFTFRVPFQMTGIKGRDPKIGIGETTVGMVVLDLRGATLNQVEPELGSGREAIETYFQNYLSLLQSAGHHVLFSLPNFDENTDDDRLRHGPYLDFSQIAYKLLGLEDVHDVSIEHINRYLSAAWLNALILANKQPFDHPAVSLAEYRSTWASQDDDLYFSINFGAPYVDALCNDEILIYFVLDDVRFYETGDFEARAPFKAYSNWKIAVLMNLIHEEEDDGNIKQCRLDLASALFMPQFSEFDGRRFDDGEDDGSYMNHMIDFISGEYLNVLENGQHHVIYHNDARSPGSSTICGQAKQHEDFGQIDETEWPSPEANEVHDLTDSKATVWRDIAQHSDMRGYDQITALSQLSINRQFRSAWSEQQSITSMTADKMLTRWEYQDRFAAIFEPLTIRLRPDGRAIVFINLTEGFLKPLANSLPNADREKYAFTGWQVAFAVDLKMCDHVALSNASPEWLERFSQSAAYKQHGNKPDVKLEHIYLDFDRVEFLHEASSFESLFTPKSSRSMNQVLAVVTYLRDHYLKRFAQLGHHVLYTIPVWQNRTSAPPYGLTSAAFQVHSNTTATASGLPTARHYQTSSPVIVILGMCGGRSLPTSALQLSTDWVAHAGRFWSHGTGGISSAVFLRERLLPLLSAVNAVTTVVPASSTIERDGKWKLELNSWAKDAQRTSRNCPFSHVPASNEEGALRYQWDHQEEFNYDQQGSSTVNGVRSVSSRTMNYLEIPTTFKDGVMEIKLGGRVDLELSVKTRNSWSSKGFSAWTVSLTVNTEAGGLRVSVLTVPTQFHKEMTRSSHNNFGTTFALNPADLLRRAVPESIDLADVVKEFEPFEDTWQFCYPRTSAYSPAHPVFNCLGDLLFELRPQPQAPRPQPQAAQTQPQVYRLQPQVPRTQPQAPRPQPQAPPLPTTTTSTTTRGPTTTRWSTVTGRGGTRTTRTEREVRHENSTTFDSGPGILRVENNAAGTHPLSSVPDGWSTSTETISYSEGDTSDSSFDLFPASPPMSSAYSATSIESTTSSCHIPPTPPSMAAARARFQQFYGATHSRPQSAAGMHQRPASAASVRPSSAASNRQQDQFNSTFTAFGDGIRIHSTPQPGDMPVSGAYTPRVQPFTTNLGVPDIFGQGVPQDIAEAVDRATTGMTSSGEYTTTTTTTTRRSTTPQLRTVRPVPVNAASSGARAFFRENFMQTSGGMGGEMGGSMIGEVFSDHDLAARFGSLGIRPGRTRTTFSSTVSGGTSTSRTSVSRGEHFVVSGFSHFQR